jgi:ABC-type Mn2+/Zn2+ transport system permease subunit
MIQEFLDSWPLFHNTYLAGWLIAVLLSMAGVIVVARDQIFLGAAISQASTMGIALAMWLGGLLPALQSDLFLSVMSVIFSMAAALITARSGTGKESNEAITGWVFLVSASVAVLLVSHSPHGLEEVHRIVASSIIGATSEDVGWLAGLTALTALVLFVFQRPLMLYSTDPVMAAAVGVPVKFADLVTTGMLGLVIGLSIGSSGMIYTFGCLVLPALIAKNLSREIRPLFWISPAIALTASTIAFVISNHYDFPPGQMTVALLGLFLVVAWAFRGALLYFRERAGASA